MLLVKQRLLFVVINKKIKIFNIEYFASERLLSNYNDFLSSL